MAEIDRSQVKWDAAPSIDAANVQWDEPALSNRGNAAVGGVNRGIAAILGIPIDTAENVLNLGRAGIGSAMIAAGRPDLAPELRTGTPGGSQWIAQQIERMGINASNPNPEDTTSQMLYRAGTIAPAAAIPGASLRQTALSAGGAAVGEQIAGPEGAMTGALLPAAGSAVAGRVRESFPGRAQNPQREETLAAAREAGYRFPPAETNPTVQNRLLEGWAGKLTTRQRVSEHNSEVTNNLAKRSLGLKPTDPLTEDAIGQVYDRGYAAYDAIKRQPGPFTTDKKLRDDINSLDAAVARASKEYPDLIKNPGIDDLKTALSAKDTHNPEAMVELIKELRRQSKANYRGSIGAQKPADQIALADAQRKAATFLEDFIERQASPALVRDFREGRTMIARAHDVEAAFNEGSGNVNARVFASLMDKNRPLGGGLETIGRTYKAFPHALKTPESIGSQPFFSPLDVGAGAMVGGGNAPTLATLLAGRPLIRAAITSGPYQRAFGTPSQATPPETGLAALARGYLSAPITQLEPLR